MAQHDSGYKLLFSHPQMVEELLRGFVHEPWVEDLDYGSLEPAEASFTSADLRERHGEELPDLTAELAALLPKGKESELRQDFTTWLRQLLRRLRPGVTIPQVGDLEEIAMLEETLTEWLNGAERKGRTEGRKEGLQAGRQEGQIEGMRQLLLRQLERRFGVLPQGVRRRVRVISSTKKLEELAERVLVVDSLAEMDLGQRTRVRPSSQDNGPA
jgi:hypothetical protein